MPVTSDGFSSAVRSRWRQVSPSSCDVASHSRSPSPSGPASASKKLRPIEPTYQQWTAVELTTKLASPKPDLAVWARSTFSGPHELPRSSEQR